MRMKTYAKISYLDYIIEITHAKSMFQYVFIGRTYFQLINMSIKDILKYKHSSFIYIHTQQNILYHNLDSHSATTSPLNTFESYHKYKGVCYTI